MSNYRVQGQLDLQFERVGDRTVMRVGAMRPPLQVVRAFDLPDATALVHLHTVSGGVLGGDQLEVALKVGRGARVQLTTTSATRVYRNREGAPPAFQSNTVIIEKGSLLEYIPDALIPFAGARYRQETQITLADDAGLFWWEVIAPGREARGELFAYDLLQLHTAIDAEGRPMLRERARLEPTQRPLNISARLGDYRYTASFYICKTGLTVTAWSGLEAQLQAQAHAMTQIGSILWGVSSLPTHGLIVRALAMRGRDIFPGLFAFWKSAKRALYGLDAVWPRKIW